MQFSSIVATLLSTMAIGTMASPTTAQDNCYQGYKYCGSDLLKHGIFYSSIRLWDVWSESWIIYTNDSTTGDYKYTIQQALVSANMPYDDPHVQNTLFLCIADGWISSPVYCSAGCKTEADGSHKDDSCL